MSTAIRRARAALREARRHLTDATSTEHSEGIIVFHMGEQCSWRMAFCAVRAATPHV